MPAAIATIFLHVLTQKVRTPEGCLNDLRMRSSAGMPDQVIIAKPGTVKLKEWDPAFCGEIEKEDAKQKTRKLCKRVDKLQQLLYANSNQAIILLFQGVDACGKDGAIRSVLHRANPAGIETVSFKEPSAEERAHDFLWRVHKAVPRYGNMGVFNRSHYEAVLAERVLGIAKPQDWQKRFAQIVAFERMLWQNNVLVVKFYLHLSLEEQARRFERRQADPRKHWKLTRADLKARELWNDYEKAYEDMLNKTSHPAARWHIIPADHKWYRDYIVAQTVVRALEGLNMKWPPPKEDFSKIKIK